MMQDSSSDIRETIKEYLETIQGIAAAYLFGSCVKGRLKSGSDIDLALLFSGHNKSQIDRLAIMADLSRLTGRDVDLVVLNESSPMLYHEILRTGILLFEKNRKYRIKKEVINRKQFQDYLHFHNIHINAIRRRHG